MQKNRKHEIDKICGAHELYLCTGSAPGFLQRFTCNSGKTCTKGGCRSGSRQPRLMGETCEGAQCSRSCSPVSLLRRQLVGVLGGLNAPKNKVAFLETSGSNFAAMVAAQSLLVSSSSYSSLKTVLLEEQCIILPQLLLLELIVSEHSRRSVYEFRGENCLCSIDKSKGCLSGGSIWCRPD